MKVPYSSIPRVAIFMSDQYDPEPAVLLTSRADHYREMKSSSQGNLECNPNILSESLVAAHHTSLASHQLDQRHTPNEISRRFHNRGNGLSRQHTQINFWTFLRRHGWFRSSTQIDGVCACECIVRNVERIAVMRLPPNLAAKRRPAYELNNGRYQGQKSILELRVVLDCTAVKKDLRLDAIRQQDSRYVYGPIMTAQELRKRAEAMDHLVIR
ncbi:hypothetical protein KCU87_g42, partial [Aureobasidium melanogenum]